MLTIFRNVLLSLGVMALLMAAPANAKLKATGNKAATPEAQALKIYQSLRDQDYKAMYYLLAATEKGKATFGTVEQFALDVQKGYDGSFKTPEEKAASDNLLKSISDIMIGEPVITGNKAVVPTSAKITVNSKVYTFKGEAFLIKDDGVWKLDLTFDENSEKAMGQRTAELLGRPVTQ
ncbi:MAG: hypothetical protein ACREPB_01560 [Arenimonas sp.]